MQKLECSIISLIFLTEVKKVIGVVRVFRRSIVLFLLDSAYIVLPDGQLLTYFSKIIQDKG